VKYNQAIKKKETLTLTKAMLISGTLDNIKNMNRRIATIYVIKLRKKLGGL